MSRAAGDDAVRAAVEHIAAGHTGTLAVAAEELGNGRSVLFHEDEVLPTASVIKIPVLVELARQVHGGGLSWDDRVTVRSEDRLGGSGILKLLAGGLRPTLRDLATLMVCLSDNTATNYVIDAVGGVGAVNAAMDELGLRTVRLHNRVDFELIGDDVRRFGESSPREMLALVRGIAAGEVFGPEVSAAVEEVLSHQQYLDQVPRYLTVSPYDADLGIEAEVTVANKTGFFPGTRVDAGILRFRPGGGVAYAVFHHGSADAGFLPEGEGSVVLGLVGRTLVEHWWPGPAGTAPVAATAYTAPAPAGAERGAGEHE